MKDLCKLFGQGLLSLQVLHGSVGRARQRFQQAAQGILCKDMHTSEIQFTQAHSNLLVTLYTLLSHLKTLLCH